METLVLKKRLDISRQIVLDLPQFNEGDEVELVVVINSLLKSKKEEKTFFDIKQWGEQWETNLGEDIQSTDVEAFTGRKF
jgi:hypothetical protein